MRSGPGLDIFAILQLVFEVSHRRLTFVALYESPDVPQLGRTPGATLDQHPSWYLHLAESGLAVGVLNAKNVTSQVLLVPKSAVKSKTSLKKPW
jgi:hypothetical protein